jgi:hypothetical protein
MYTKVHILTDANHLRWSGVEAQCSPNATKAHRILLEPSHQDGSEGFRSIENKIFPTKTNKNKPRSDLRDAKQRVGEIRSTYPCRSHSENV